MKVKYALDTEYPGLAQKSPELQAKCGRLFLDFYVTFYDFAQRVEAQRVRRNHKYYDRRARKQARERQAQKEV